MLSIIPKLTILLFLLYIFFTTGASSLAFESLKPSEIDLMAKRVCTSKLEDCLSDPEIDPENNSSRRVLLMRRRYISYDTLTRDMVPCEKPGASYYACHQGQANPYSRGCEVITRCARDAKN